MKQERSSVWFALWVLFAINAMNFFDRQILGAVGEAVRREWGMSDGAMGALGTAFTLLYAFVGVPLGRLADRSRRKWILSAGVFVWSLTTVLSGFAQKFLAVVCTASGRRRGRSFMRARRYVFNRRSVSGEPQVQSAFDFYAGAARWNCFELRRERNDCALARLATGVSTWRVFRGCSARWPSCL